jgi:S-adenosyl-L-methionine hydrolase (adenosine-forming)
MVGGADRAVALTNAEYQLPAPGPTFAGRDVMAPAAAHLCNGVPLDELGDAVDTATLRPGILPLSAEEDGGLSAEVLWVDRFGNAQLNVDPSEVEAWGDRIRLAWGTAARTAVRATTYAELRPGEVGLVVDSYGLLAVVVDQGSAAEQLGLPTGTGVRLEPLEDEAVTVRGTDGR